LDCVGNPAFCALDGALVPGWFRFAEALIAAAPAAATPAAATTPTAIFEPVREVLSLLLPFCVPAASLFDEEFFGELILASPFVEVRPFVALPFEEPLFELAFDAEALATLAPDFSGLFADREEGLEEPFEAVRDVPFAPEAVFDLAAP
jgi:hypothetical protein